MDSSWELREFKKEAEDSISSPIDAELSLAYNHDRNITESLVIE